MNIKKIGLTALAASLVSVSAHAGEMSVAGGASLGLKNTSKTSTGKSWTMGNQLTFTGGGELDNGLNVSLSFVLDQGDDSTTTGTAHNKTSPFDSHSLTISSDDLGSVTFNPEGGSSAQGAIDTTAAGDAWNNGSSIAVSSSEAANNLVYTLPSMIDDVTIVGSYSPGGAGGDSATAWRVGYSGIEGLSLDLAEGETNTVGSEATTTTMKASYAISSFTVSYSDNEHDTTATTGGQDITSWNVAYTVSEDLSINYGTETHDAEGSSVDEEAEVIGVSYTTGGMTISANQYNYEGNGNVAGAAGEKERWALSATFAF
jgi:outer membrane protein OmpU